MVYKFMEKFMAERLGLKSLLLKSSCLKHLWLTHGVENFRVEMSFNLE